MAVQDVNVAGTVTALQALAMTRALYGKGANIGALLATASIAAADDNGSVFRLFPALVPTLIPLAIFVGNTLITAGTVYDIGVYENGVGGAAILDEVFASALDMSAAHASMNPKTALDGMKDCLPADVGKHLYEHAGHTVQNMRDSYDIALTADTIGTAAGTVTALLIYALG